MQRSAIQWTEMTWNPTRGCSRVSEGCKHCYAERFAGRFSEQGVFKGYVSKVGGEARWTGKVSLISHKLSEPLGFQESHLIFVNSMSDLFHPELSDEDIGLVWLVMASCLPQFHAMFAAHHKPKFQVFQVLTKRPERMEAWLRKVWPSISWRRTLLDRLRDAVPRHRMTPVEFLDQVPDELPNVCLGVSIEDQVTAAQRLPSLLRCPAAFRFVSYEPALEPVDLSTWLFDRDQTVADFMHGPSRLDRETAEQTIPPTLDLVIAGGESGPNTQLAELSWFFDVAEQARAARSEFMLKQLGTMLARDLGFTDRKGGNPNEWPDEARARLVGSGDPFRNVFTKEVIRD